MAHLYQGPIIDAHHHLWDAHQDKHPWLRTGTSFGPPGRYDALKGTSYLVDDYLTDASNQGIVASVHVEALWDPTDGLEGETAWLESLEKTNNVAFRYVAGAIFGRPSSEHDIRKQATNTRVKAIRQTVAWTSDPARQMAPRPHIVREPAFLALMPVLIELDLGLELLIYPPQFEDIVQLSLQFPDLRIIVDHLGSPIDQSAGGLQLWREGIAAIGTRPNVHLKISSAGAYVPHLDVASVEPFIHFAVENIGAKRLMIGSDSPVSSIHGLSLAGYFDLYRQCLKRLPAKAQSDIFFGTASRVYDITI